MTPRSKPYTVAQLAEEEQVSVFHIRQEIKRGNLIARNIATAPGRTLYRIDPDRIAEWRKAQETSNVKTLPKRRERSKFSPRLIDGGDEAA